VEEEGELQRAPAASDEVHDEWGGGAGVVSGPLSGRGSEGGLRPPRLCPPCTPNTHGVLDLVLLQRATLRAKGGAIGGACEL
jgi:hypothetical protein